MYIFQSFFSEDSLELDTKHFVKNWKWILPVVLSLTITSSIKKEKEREFQII